MKFRSMGIAASVALASLLSVGAASADPVVVSGQIAIPAPPAPRVEVRPARPSTAHVWRSGYYHWHPIQRSYVWVPGYWHYEYAPSAPPAIRVEAPGRPPSARHFWSKGHWKYDGREWIWVGGHWADVRAGYEYVHPHWDRVNGRWKFAVKLHVMVFSSSIGTKACPPPPPRFVGELISTTAWLGGIV